MRLQKLWAAAVAGVLAITFAGLASAPAHAADGTATFTGTVTVKGQPLVGRTVGIAPPNDDSDIIYTKTDSTGSYSAAVPPGSYQVWITVTTDDDGYPEFARGLEYRFTMGGDKVRRSDGTVYTLAAGETVNVDIAAAPAPVLRGRVVGHDGKPLAGVDLRASNTKRPGSAEDRTDHRDGSFVLYGLNGGEVSIRASRKHADVSTTVTATPGSTTQLEDIVLDMRRGTVTATIKRVKKGDRIMVYPRGGYAQEITRAKKSGTLKVKTKLSPGRYRIGVHRLNLVTKEVRVRAERTVSAGTISAPTKRTKLTGIVKASNGKRLANAQVTVYDRYGTGLQSKRTDSKGRYSFSNLWRGTYRVVAQDRTLGNSPKDAKIKLKKNKNAKQNFRLYKAHTITGTVVHAGQPVAGVAVTGFSRGDRIFIDSTTTDADGRFTLKGMPRKARLSAHDTEGLYLDRRKTISVPLDPGFELTVSK